MKPFEELESEIRACQICREFLVPRPILQISPLARIVIIGQAPGAKVARSGIPWNDESGRRLRDWLGVSDATFYDAKQVALVPMGFCYPGPGTSGDKPPRPECAPQWHDAILDRLPESKLRIFIGKFAHERYLGENQGMNLTESVRAWRSWMTQGVVPLVHPSPRNRFWMKQNPWFETDLVPELRLQVSKCLM